MKRCRWVLGYLLTAALLAGCVPARPAEESAIFISHGYLRDECVAQIGQAQYAFLAAEGEPSQRTFLYELDEEGGKKRIVCEKEGCLHEQQGRLADPCHAYSYVTQGLMAEDGMLYAGSRNGQMGVVQFDPQGGMPRTVLTAPQEMACFLADSGWIYYAQQDQSFAETAPSDPEHGYRLMRRVLDNPAAEAETVYQRTGTVGYVACVQRIGDWLYLTEIYRDDDDPDTAKMNIVRLRPDGSDAELFVEHAGGHFIAQVGEGYAVSRQNADGTWSAVLLDAAGRETAILQSSDRALMLCGIQGKAVVDSGKNELDKEQQRTLCVYDEEGHLLGGCEIPQALSTLLGMDAEHVYYWEENKLTALDWIALIE